MSSRASKKNRNRWSKEKLEWEKKKVSCECSGSILKKQTNNCDKKTKNSLLIRAIQKVIAVFWREKKERKRNNDQWQSRCHILLRSTKMKENYKKNRNRKRFSCFFNNTTKGRTFQFLMTISMPARPPTPFKPLRMNVNRHYYIKTKKQEKINSHPPPTPKKKCVTSKNLTTKDKNERETALTFDRAALTSAAHWSVMNTRSKSFHGWIYFVLKKQCNSILLHWSVFNMLF